MKSLAFMRPWFDFKIAGFIQSLVVLQVKP